MKYTEIEIDDMIASLQNAMEYLEEVHNNSDLKERNKIMYDLQQLSKIEKLLLHLENED